MGTQKLNGSIFEKMFRNGLANLQAHEDEVNKLNVFPVTDGDTGTNMILTLAHGLEAAPPRLESGAYLKGLSDGMLFGARGNSGVILSQLFRGIYLELSHCGSVNPGELRNAFIRAYRVAYESVVKPVEGTILTVTREGIEHIRDHVSRTTTIEALLSMYLAEMRKTLALTPQMLSVLKEAGVVDSGAYGYILIVEGMLKYLYGEVIEERKTVTSRSAGTTVPAVQQPVCIDEALFNENSAFLEGYCTEFILQLMTGEKYSQKFRLQRFKDDLSVVGTSLVAVQNGMRVKVHIHTFTPAKVIALAQKYGEFLTFKLENMQLQHNEVMQGLPSASSGAPKKLAVIAAAGGEGIAALYSEFECVTLVDCTDILNSSAQDFADAIAQVNAEKIVILPNNKNMIPAAEQAVRLTQVKNAVVLPSCSFAEGYFALAMDVPDDNDAENRVAGMREGLESVVTVSEAIASKDCEADGVRVRTGENIALVGEKIVCVSTDWCDCIVSGLRAVPDIEDRETCLVLRGAGVPEELETILCDRIASVFPSLEVNVINGGQKVYHWVLGVM